MKLDLDALDTIDRLMAKKSAWTLEETAAVYDAVPALVREVRAARGWASARETADQFQYHSAANPHLNQAGLDEEANEAFEAYCAIVEENSRD